MFVIMCMLVNGYSKVTLQLPNHIFTSYYNLNRVVCKVQHSVIHTSILLLACTHTKPYTKSTSGIFVIITPKIHVNPKHMPTVLKIYPP